MAMQNLTFSSDYPIPPTVWRATGEFTIQNTGSTGFYSFTHGLPFIPLIIGMLSTDPNFESASDIQTEITGAGSTNDKVYIVWVDGAYPNGTKLYYRLWAFAPPDYVGDLSVIPGQSRFLLDTDFKYLQLQQEGVAYPEDPPGPSIMYEYKEIKRPLARVWNWDDFVLGGNTVSLLSAQQSFAVDVRRWEPFYDYNRRAILNDGFLWIGIIPEGKVAYYHIYANEG